MFVFSFDCRSCWISLEPEQSFPPMRHSRFIATWRSGRSGKVGEGNASTWGRERKHLGKAPSESWSVPSDSRTFCCGLEAPASTSSGLLCLLDGTLQRLRGRICFFLVSVRAWAWLRLATHHKEHPGQPFCSGKMMELQKKKLRRAGMLESVMKES